MKSVACEEVVCLSLNKYLIVEQLLGALRTIPSQAPSQEPLTAWVEETTLFTE